MKLTALRLANFPKPFRLVLFLGLLACSIYTPANAQTLITFPSGNISPTYSDPGLSHVSNIGAGPGITVVSCPPWLSATGWNYLFLEDAMNNGQYWEFIVDVAQGYEININEIEVLSRASDTTYSRVAGQWLYQTEDLPGIWQYSLFSSSMQGIGRNDICLLGARSRAFPMTINTSGRITFRLVHFRAFNNQTRIGSILIKGALTAALPVELTAFEAKARQRDVLLQWQTSSEQRNQGFEVQRLNEQHEWDFIGWQQGQGTTSEANVYEFRDDAPEPGDNLYRLKQVDWDGQFSFSPVVTASFEQSKSEINLFPNPSNGPLQLRVFNPEGQKMQLNLFDSIGRKIWGTPSNIQDRTLKQTFQLKPGCQYFFQAQIGDRQINRVILVQSEN
ncbi:MAG: T9SS type A sorting domain-containing protein [Bacteroidota bacterium]